MQWRRIFIRKDILTHGTILAQTQQSFQIAFTPPSGGQMQIVPSSTPSLPPTTIPQLLNLPTGVPEIPHTPRDIHTRAILEILRERLSQSQVLVLHYGEPITAFHGLNLVELPTPLIGAKKIDVNYYNPDDIILSGMFIAYGRRLFLAVRPLQGSSRDKLMLRPGFITRVPLPNTFGTTLSPGFVEDHRLFDRYLDPTVVLGVSPTRLLDPIVESVEPVWHGFLRIEQHNGAELCMRASAIRLAFPRQPVIRELERLPAWISFTTGDVIPAAECMNKVSVPNAEWLGVFVPKDETGVTPNCERLDMLFANMLSYRFAYTCRLARGTMYMWCMHFGGMEPGKYTFVFAIVPNNGITIRDMTISRPDAVEWRGRLVISGMEFPVAAVRWLVPGRRMIDNYNWGPRLEFDARVNVRAVMRTLVALGRWAVRFLPDEDDFVLDLQLLTVGFSLMESGKAYRVRIGERGEMGDLVLFATNHEGVGTCLMGVCMGPGVLGI